MRRNFARRCRLSFLISSGSTRSLFAAEYATALEEEEAINQQLHSYLDFHGNILAHDKKGILGSGVSIYDTIAEPFQLATRLRAAC